jgi:hypothetical protein
MISPGLTQYLLCGITGGLGKINASDFSTEDGFHRSNAQLIRPVVFRARCAHGSPHLATVRESQPSLTIKKRPIKTVAHKELPNNTIGFH